MKKIKLSLIVILFTGINYLNSQEQTSLSQENVSVELVLKNYLKAIGGEDAIEKVQNKIQKTSMVSVMNFGGNTTTTKSKMIQSFTKDGKMVSISGVNDDFSSYIYFDGKKGYTYLKAFKNKTPFTPEITSMYKKIKIFPTDFDLSTYDENVATEKFNGEDCYVLNQVSNPAGTEMKTQLYYSKETGLLIGSKVKTDQMESVTYITDYKEVDGILASFQQTSKSELAGGNSMSSSLRIVDLEYNGNIGPYFKEDYKLAAKQIASIDAANSAHNEKLSSLASVNLDDISSAKSISNSTSSPTENKVNFGSNKRDLALKAYLENKNRETSSSTVTSASTVSSTGKKTDVEDLEKEYNDFKDLKYRRSSLYTMMINDAKRERNNIIRNSFGNSELSPKFNDHNIGPYLIEGEGAQKDQTKNIENYLNRNNIAKELVAKWFNRSPDGYFNMDLIAERGQYNASDLSNQIANSSIRGNALLKDAGTELIGNTFLIVYDYKYTNKEKSAKKRGGFLNAVSSVASFIPGAEDVVTVANTAKIASDVVGKGYYIVTTTYLYQLVWDDETANTFYEKYWIDASNADPKKRDAFDKTDLFKLKYVGSEVSRNNLQSTIFTTKSNDQLIEIATVRAIDKNIGKLQRTFEEFRVKTPLLSGDPISAKIGTKEGIEKGDRFEVLEQTIDEEGITSYKRVGVIKVDSKNIWDNAYLSEEQEIATVKEPTKTGAVTKGIGSALSKKIPYLSLFNKKKKNKKKKKKKVKKIKKEEEQKEKLEYTLFKGKGKYASGMLIRQIN